MAISTSQLFIDTFRRPLVAEVPATRSTDASIAHSTNEFVWELARKFTDSPEEAEAAVREMFKDIQECSDLGDDVSSHDDRLRATIAWRRLVNFLR